MTKRERIQFLLTWFILGVVPLMLRPLWETDEGRYAEIPREMLASGDWLTPKLNYVLYFEKPPLQYWLSAVSMKLFGGNAFAARLPLALASFIALWCAWRLSRRLGARDAVWASFMAATALLGFSCGQFLTLDALFSAFMVLALTAAIEAVAARFDQRPSLGWTMLAFGATALAVLTKGLAAPVLLGCVILASLPWAWRSARLRNAVLRTFCDPLGWLLFMVLAAPWFWCVERTNPGHARFFFIHEHFARYTSTIHARQGSNNPFLDKLYFVPVLAFGLMPWLSASCAGLWRGVKFLRGSKGPADDRTPLHRWIVAALLLGAAVPFLFFSVSGSKLAPYILPSLVPILALACALERPGEEVASFRRTGRELIVLGGLFLLVAPFLLKDHGGLAWVMALGGAFALAGLWTFQPKGLTGNRWMAALALACLLLSGAAQKAAGAGKSVDHFVAQAPANAQWISLGNYYQGIPFYAHRRVAVVAGAGELAFGRDRLAPEERGRWFGEPPAAFTPMALRLRQEAPARPVWAIAHRDTWTKGLPQDQRQAWDVVDQSSSAILLRLR